MTGYRNRGRSFHGVDAPADGNLLESGVSEEPCGI